jgi:hypothetical protein
MLANVDDGGATERLVPVPVCGPVAAPTGGHFGYTRYYRARNQAYNGSTITNTTVVNSATDPNIAWRHSFYFNNASTNNNMIHIWQQAPVIKIDP